MCCQIKLVQLSCFRPLRDDEKLPVRTHRIVDELNPPSQLDNKDNRVKERHKNDKAKKEKDKKKDKKDKKVNEKLKEHSRENQRGLKCSIF